MAILRISSIMLTVLPTPAPPNKPTLPPLAKGQTRSITLMPVSSNSVDAANSSKAGALRWIDIVFSAPMGPISSIGRPSTSMMRPRVLRPTGTLICSPVLVTIMPRRNPSEDPSAIVRTIPSPSCCCTSSVSSVPSSTNASYTFGIDSRGNSTSTTAPIH